MEIYEGSISSTALTAFEGVVARYPLSDYVAFRSGQYSYTLAVGDLIYDGSTVSGDAVLYTYTSYSGDYAWTNTGSAAFSVVPGDHLLYSNLGDFPILGSGGDLYAFALFFVSFVCCLCCLICSIFRCIHR